MSNKASRKATCRYIPSQFNFLGNALLHLYMILRIVQLVVKGGAASAICWSLATPCTHSEHTKVTTKTRNKIMDTKVVLFSTYLSSLVLFTIWLWFRLTVQHVHAGPCHGAILACIYTCQDRQAVIYDCLHCM